jgi:hypothetical protein
VEWLIMVREGKNLDTSRRVASILKTENTGVSFPKNPQFQTVSRPNLA